VDEVFGADRWSGEVADMLSYAIHLCITAQTYEVHAWMLLLALLRNEGCTASQVLRELGLDDIYGAWHEVLWALNVADGLRPRAFRPHLEWTPRAYRVVNGAVRFAAWAGRDTVVSEDLLLALAADGALADLFPDLDLGFDRVKRAAELTSGRQYDLPGYQGPNDSQDMFA
jgi:ATP-dependent Clp protease ATP-binding subunit ClpA